MQRIQRLGHGSPAALASLIALWLVATSNLSFWRTFLDDQPASFRTIGAALTLAALLWASTALVLHLAVYVRLQKIVWPALLIASAVAAHFIDHWGALIDKSMMRNVLETDVAETLDLLTLEFFADVLVRGGIPAAIVALWPVRRTSFLQNLKSTAFFGLCATGLLGLGSLFYSVYAPTFRNHRELRYQLVPANFLRAGYGVLRPKKLATGPLEVVAGDAARGGRSIPLTIFLIVGETARGDNFSLGGYKRPTNSSLADLGINYFQSVRSCGTDTATSLPCMFSDLKGSAYSVDRASRRENLLDILTRVGVDVTWYENNSGCKAVCDRVPTVQLADTGACTKGLCMDTDFAKLAAATPYLKDDRLVVFHQQGSHGPAYFKRYPGPGTYEPACETNQLQDCRRADVVNAYDNSIEFTSLAISQVIGAVQARPSSGSSAVAVIYISDHGESLGENGIYLHGLPALLAPHLQFHMPMLMWMDAEARKRMAPDPRCLEQDLEGDASHDNLFHTILGAYGVRTSVYRRDLDLLADSQPGSPCVPRARVFRSEHLSQAD